MSIHGLVSLLVANKAFRSLPKARSARLIDVLIRGLEHPSAARCPPTTIAPRHGTSLNTVTS